MDKSFYQKLDTINRMDNKKGEDSLAVQKKPRAPRRKEPSWTLPKEDSRTVGQLLLCSKPSFLFERSELSLGLELWISLEFLRKRYFDLGSEESRLQFDGQKKVSWIAGQLLLCSKPFVVFFKLFKDWSWETITFEK